MYHLQIIILNRWGKNYKELNNIFLNKLSKYGYDEKDTIQCWYKYKEIDAGEKDKKKFDCDSWNKTNDLMDEIYDRLWRNVADWNVKEINKNFGGDTMNSFATTFNALARKNSYAESFSSYMDWKNSKDPKETDFEILSNYARYTGYLGNFVLVPKGYNQSRGSSQKIKDYWDLSLYNLRYNKDGEDWMERVNMSFWEYINMFFLWDYIDENNKVRALFESHQLLLYPEKRVTPRCYQEKAVNEFKEFVNNANRCILRRGAFMSAMLKIEDMSHDLENRNKTDYQKIVNYLATDKILGTMEEIVCNLLNLPLSEKAKDILKVLKQELKNYKASCNH